MNTKQIVLLCTLLVSTSQAWAHQEQDDQGGAIVEPRVITLEQARVSLEAFRHITFSITDKSGDILEITSSTYLEAHKLSFSLVSYGLYVCCREEFHATDSMTTQQLLVPDFYIRDKHLVILKLPAGARLEFPLHRESFYL